MGIDPSKSQIVVSCLVASYKDFKPDKLNERFVFNDKNVNNAKGTIPGVGVIQVDAGGKIGHYKGQAAITNRKDGKETADPHGIAVRK